MNTKNKRVWNLSTYLQVFLLLCGGVLLTSCNEEERGFALPEGDIAQGKAAYSRLSCTECHSIAEIAWKGGPDNLNIQLGGEIPSKKTYGELVTSVINPSHKIALPSTQNNDTPTTNAGGSKMKNYNYVMTVQELIDLVAFLQSEYKISIPHRYSYPYYQGL
jgi:sulfur-oxidizing protein SoxX